MDGTTGLVGARAPTGRRAAAPAGGMAWPGTLVERVVSGAARSRRGGWPAAVALLTVGAVAFGRPHDRVFDAVVAVPLAVLATVPLAVVRRWPLLALGVVLAADAVFVSVARLSWPMPAVLGWLLALALCPLLLRRSHAVVLLLVSGAAVVAAVFAPAPASATPWDASVAEAMALLLAWGAGENLRSRRESAARRTEVAAQVRGLRERDAVARGRAGIARELHDVVAHHVSLIAVRAATAPYQVPDLSPAAREAFGEIATEARTALQELRAVLGVLRTADGPPSSQAPQPGLADLPELVERMRSSGMSVTVGTTGPPRPLPEAVELCCYRVVQEALTNAARHAPGDRVSVELVYRPEEVAVLVGNPGDAARGSAADPEPGFGLVGMRERVVRWAANFGPGRPERDSWWRRRSGSDHRRKHRRGHRHGHRRGDWRGD